MKDVFLVQSVNDQGCVGVPSLKTAAAASRGGALRPARHRGGALRLQALVLLVDRAPGTASGRFTTLIIMEIPLITVIMIMIDNNT